MVNKKKKSLKNTFNNIPTGARITITLMTVVGIAAATYTFTSFGSDSSNNNSSLNAVATSDVDLGSKSVEGYTVGGNKIADDKSPMAENERQARLSEIEKAKTEDGGGYMSPFEISSGKNEDQSNFIDNLLAEVDQKAERNLNSEKNKIIVPNGLDDVINRDQEALLREQRISNMENNIVKSKYNNDGSLSYNSEGQKIVYRTKSLKAYDSKYNSEDTSSNEKAQSEIDSANQISGKIISQAAELSGINLASYNGGSGGSASSARSNNQASYDGQNPGRKYSASDDPTSDEFYAPYVNQERHVPKPDYEGLNDTRQQVGSSMNLGGFSNYPGNSYESDSRQPYQISNNDATSNEDYEYGYTQSTLNQSNINPDLPYKALGDICYGKLKMNINSDSPTPVRVQFLDRRCGELYDSIAVAAPARVGEYVTLEFKGINVRGKTQSINAIALDPKSESALFQDNLDRHIFSRYISLAAAAALPGWSEAVTGTRVEDDGDGGEIKVQAPVEALSDQIAVVAGSIGEVLTPLLQSNFERPPTVEVYNNKDILIMFMGDFFIE